MTKNHVVNTSNRSIYSTFIKSRMGFHVIYSLFFHLWENAFTLVAPAGGDSGTQYKVHSFDNRQK